MISSRKWQQLHKRMQEFNILESDLHEKFIHGSGHGGQKLQKTASCVYLKHLPSSTEIKCQKSRMRDDNRYYARRRLCDKLEEQLYQEESRAQQEIAKMITLWQAV